MRGIFLSVLVMAALSGAAMAQQPDAGALYKRFHEAINRGDAASALQWLAEDAEWTRAPTCRPACKGKARLETEVRRQIADHNATSAFTWSPGEKAVVRFEHRSDFTTKRGFERRVQLDTVTAANGKIVSIVSELDLSDPMTAKFAATPP